MAAPRVVESLVLALRVNRSGGFLFYGMDSRAGVCSLLRFQSPKPLRMTTPATPSSPKPAGDDRNLVAVDENYVAMSFEDKLQIFWKKNGTGVLALCGPDRK